MNSKVGVALFGFGRIGQVHTHNVLLSTKAAIKWIVDEDLTSAKKFIEDHDLNATCETPDRIEEVLSDKSVHAVFICSPGSTHEFQIRKSLHAGKPVFCEKPLTTDVASAQDLYDIAKEKMLPLMCAFQRRFDPSFKQLKESLTLKKLGRLRLLKASSHDFLPPTKSYLETSDGILTDSTIHDLDMSLWLSGGKPISVYVTGTAFRTETEECNDLDLVTVTIKYDNGVISVIDNGRQTGYGYDQRLEALCDKGLLSVTNRPTHQLFEFDSQGTNMPEYDKLFTTRYEDAYRIEMEHFLDVVSGNCDLNVTERDTIAALSLAKACNESLRRGTPINLLNGLVQTNGL